MCGSWLATGRLALNGISLRKIYEFFGSALRTVSRNQSNLSGSRPAPRRQHGEAKCLALVPRPPISF
jgi:hypothetical protein